MLVEQRLDVDERFRLCLWLPLLRARAQVPEFGALAVDDLLGFPVALLPFARRGGRLFGLAFFGLALFGRWRFCFSLTTFFGFRRFRWASPETARLSPASKPCWVLTSPSS